MTTLTAPVHHISHADRERILAYYRVAQPLLLQHFGGTPMVYAAYPRGLENYAVYHGAVHAKPAGNLPTVEVLTGAGPRTFVALSQRAMDWMLAHTSAVEFYGWGCTQSDPTRARFARILLELDPHNRQSLAHAALALREHLRAQKLQAIPVDAGGRGLALWIPLDGALHYDAVRAWLHAFCVIAVVTDPNRFTLEPNTIRSGRVHLHITSNAPGRYSALPYSLRGDADLPVCAPLTWDEIAAGMSPITEQAFPQRLATLGDVFAAELARIGEQSLPGAPTLAAAPKHARPIEPQGHTLRAVAAVLQDGKPRDVKQLLAEAVARGLLPPETKPKWIYTALLEYIVRTSGHGHKPFVVQDSDRRFRLNEPRDDWPSLEPPPTPPLDPSTQALIDRLAQTAHGDDPAAFELAVCDAFAHLGFVTTHVGGHDNTDGYADAPLGALGYRTMLECKSGPEVVHEADAVEASKFKDRFGAQVCALVGSKFTQELELASELQTHGVAAFCLEDLQQLLRVRSNPHEMRPLFEPGFVSDRIDDLLWERLHGRTKRVMLIASYVWDEGWNAQVAFAKAGPAPVVAQAPRLTVDAAMLLVDQRLAEEGASAACARTEVEDAFAYLTNPLVGRAAWLDDRRDALVVCAPLEVPSNG